MTCVDVQERLSAFADGEDARPAEVEGHLRGCPSCASALSELRAGLASLDAAFAPLGLRADAGAARALAGLPPDRVHAGLPFWSVPVAAAAGFLVAALFMKGAPPPASKGPDPVVAAREHERQEILAEAEKAFGQAEMQCTSEGTDRAIRKRGDACVAPLVEWIGKTDAKAHPGGRSMAARVVCDLATREHVPLLLGLLDDPEVELRSLANRGLARITGFPPVSESACTSSSLRASWEQKLSEK